MHDSHKGQRESSDQDQQRIERLYGTLPGKAHRLHQQLQVSRAGRIFRHAHHTWALLISLYPLYPGRVEEVFPLLYLGRVE